VIPDAGGVVSAASSVDEGLIAGRALLDVPAAGRPTAIIAQSDLLAVGVLAAAEELGLGVPEDLSVVGFDAIPLAGMPSRTLTTVAQPIEAKGAAAGRAVLAALRGDAFDDLVLRCELRIGGTTGPAPATRAS
jgi:DNA-binding LacI/PurR family transcriptional regulator